METKKILFVIFISSIVLSLSGQNQVLDNSNTMSPYERVKSLNLGDSICYLGDCVYAFGSADYSEYDPYTYFGYRDPFNKFSRYYNALILKWGFVNANGNVLERAKWDRIGAFWYRGNTLYVKKDVNKEIVNIYEFHDGMVPVGIFKKDKTEHGLSKTVYGHFLYGYADTTAKLMIKPAYQVAGPFSEGLAPVAKKTDGLFGYIDKMGKWIIKPQYISAAAFSEELAAVAYVNDEEDVVMGYIDNTGEMVLKIDWPSIRSEMKWYQTDDNRLGPFINGTADIYANLHYWVVRIGEKVEDLHYRCKIDKKGHLWEESNVIFCKGNKDESYIAVRKDSLWGVIDYFGNVILPPQRLIPECILDIDSIEDPEVLDKVRQILTNRLRLIELIQDINI